MAPRKGFSAGIAFWVSLSDRRSFCVTKACNLLNPRQGLTGRKAETQSQGPTDCFCRIPGCRKGEERPLWQLKGKRFGLTRRDLEGESQADVGLTSRRIAQGIPKQFDLPVGFRGGVRLEWRNTMKSLAQKVQRFLVCEDGPTAVEYAVMLALIVIVCLTAIQAIGTKASTQVQHGSVRACRNARWPFTIRSRSSGRRAKIR